MTTNDSKEPREPVFAMGVSGDQILVGYVKLRSEEFIPESGMAGGGWIIFGRNKKPKSLAPTREDAIDLLRAPYDNKLIAKQHEKELRKGEWY